MSKPSFLRLSPEQQNLLLEMPFDGHHVVSGPAGSGKTLLALFRASMLEIAGRSVLLLTHSNALRQYVSHMADLLKFRGRVATCHSWFQEYWRSRFSEDPPKKDDGVGLDWTELMSSLGNHGTLFDKEVDCLVIDEGQDLHNIFYALCGNLARSVTVFADDSQRIGEEQSTVNEIRGLLGTGVRYQHLSGNHRNTRQIWQLAELFHSRAPEELPDPPQRQGPTPTLRRHPTEKIFASALASYSLANRKADIGVVLPRQRQLVSMMDELRKRGVRNVQAYVGASRHFRELQYRNPGIKVLTPISVKGQEFDTVFAHHLDLYEGDPSSVTMRALVHVMVTRARHELHLSYQSETEPEIVRKISPLVLARPDSLPVLDDQT